MEKAKIPEAIQEIYKTPVFTRLTLARQDEVKMIVEWMVDKKLLPVAYAYYDLVDDNLLPIRIER